MAAPRTAADRVQLVVRISACGGGGGGGGDGYQVTAVAQPMPDDEYRVLVRAPEGLAQCSRLPPPHEDWCLKYVFACPQLPDPAHFDAHMHTIYVWGDIDFDGHGAHGPAPISAYVMNQIVPQVMIGRCLGESDARTFEPGWIDYDRWVMQAQYYWQTPACASKAKCGPAIEVAPGERITTLVEYSAGSGAIRVEIRCDDGRSSVVELPRPFPDGGDFGSWREFFEKGQAASEAKGLPAGCFGRPMLDIEYKGSVDLRVLRSVCPFRVEEVSGPGFGPELTADWRPSLFCPRLGECHELSSLSGDRDGVLRTADAYACTRVG